jgi:hypothetical protein
MVVLTEVRPLLHPRQVRDERTAPEHVLEAVPAADLTAAQAVFSSLCGLRPVQAGRQRPKVIALSGRDTDATLAASLMSRGLPAGAR